MVSMYVAERRARLVRRHRIAPAEPADSLTAAAEAMAGVACVVAGWVWNYWFPVNKALWTSSYVLLTAGMALQLLAVCYWLIDLKGYRRWALPFVVFGTNALAVFFLTGLCPRLVNWIKVTGADGKPEGLLNYLYQTLFASWMSPISRRRLPSPVSASVSASWRLRRSSSTFSR